VSGKTSESVITRRGLLCGLTALAGTAVAGPAFASAPALLKGAGNFRSVKLVNNRTGDWINTVYWVEGQYIPEVMDDINYLMRDWRAEKVKKIDPRTIDILSATHRLLDCREPFEVISGYRTKQTNAMLRKRSRGVASNSYHIKAMAVDISMKSRSVRQISRAGLSLGAGGVGKYSRSDFVHLDSGPVRTWGG